MMPKSSPARSQSALLTPRRSRPRSSRSLGTPTPSRSSRRLNNIENKSQKGARDQFSVSPLSKTVLSDNTEIDMPRRQSWWRKVDNSRDMTEVLNNEKPANEVADVLEEFDVEVLSQGKKHHTMDIPESSGSESIGSIVLPQRRLFTQKENIPQNKFGQVIGNREALTKHNKTNFNDKSLDVGPKNLFARTSMRPKPVFPSALLNMSLDKTANKTKEPPAEVEGQQKNLFGNRLGTKRKNMFADFVVSESEDDSTIPDIQPKLFAFQKQSEPTGRSSTNSRGFRDQSPASSITTDIEMDDWKLLPSSTMVEHQLQVDLATPGKRARLSKVSELKESTKDSTKQSDGFNSKNKSKVLSPAKNQEVDVSTARDKSKVRANKSMGTRKNTSLNKSKGNSNQLKNKSKTENIATNFEENPNEIDNYPTNIDEGANEITFGKDKTRVINRTTTLKKVELDESAQSQLNVQSNESVSKNKSKLLSPAKDQELSTAKDKTRDGDESIASKKNLNQNKSKQNSSQLKNKSKTGNISTNVEGANDIMAMVTNVDERTDEIIFGKDRTGVINKTSTLRKDDLDEITSQKNNTQTKLNVEKSQGDNINEDEKEISNAKDRTRVINKTVTLNRLSQIQNLNEELNEQQELVIQKNIETEVDQDEQMEENITLTYDDNDQEEQENIEDKTLEPEKQVEATDDKTDQDNNKKERREGAQESDQAIDNKDSDKSKIDEIAKEQENFEKRAKLSTLSEATEDTTKQLEKSAVSKNKSKILSPDNSLTANNTTQYTSKANLSKQKYNDETSQRVDAEKQNVYLPNERLKDPITSEVENAVQNQDNHNKEEDVEMRQEVEDNEQMKTEDDIRNQEKDKEHEQNEIEKDQVGHNEDEQNLKDSEQVQSKGEQDETEEDQLNNEVQSDNEHNEEDEHINKEIEDQQSENEQEEDRVSQEIEDRQSEDEQNISEVQNEIEEDPSDNDQQSDDEVNKEEGEISQEAMEQESDNEQQEDQVSQEEQSDYEQDEIDEIQEDPGEEAESEGEQEISQEKEHQVSQEEQSDIEEDEIEGIDQEAEAQSEDEQDDDDQETSQGIEDQEDLDQEIETQSEGEQEIEEQHDNDEQEDIPNDQSDQETENTDDQENAIDGTDEDHDTTGRNRRKRRSETVEALRKRDSHNDSASSFTAKGRNTSIRKTKSIINNFSMLLQRESLGFSDRTEDSSAQGSWDSHRTTRKTLRQTFGRDFTPRKSLRALVMEKSAKRQTIINEANAKLKQGNSTEIENDDFGIEFDENIENVDPVESDHEQSRIMRQAKLEEYLEKAKKDNRERKQKIEQQVNSWLKSKPSSSGNIFNFRVPARPAIRRIKAPQVSPKAPKVKRSNPFNIPLEDLPSELVEDMKYKPPKRFRQSNASWITKRLYKFLETKLEPKYDYKARVRAEKLVKTIYNFVRDIRRLQTAPSHSVGELKREMARLEVVTTHFDFYNFFNDYLPLEVKIKVVPDIINDIPLPRNGIFSPIIE